MTRDQISLSVRTLVANHYRRPLSAITEATNFATDLDGDSLDSIEIVMELELEFDVEVPDEAADEITTVAQAVGYLVGVLAVAA